MQRRAGACVDLAIGVLAVTAKDEIVEEEEKMWNICLLLGDEIDYDGARCCCIRQDPCCCCLTPRDRSVSLSHSARPRGLAPLSRETTRSRTFAVRYHPRRHSHVVLVQCLCETDDIFTQKHLHPEYS